MSKQAKNPVKILSLRLPQAVAKAVAKRAKSQNRSINAQIIHEITYSPKSFSDLWKGPNLPIINDNL